MLREGGELGEDRLQDSSFLRERVAEPEAAKRQNIRIGKELQKREEESRQQAERLASFNRMISALAFSLYVEAGFKLLSAEAKGLFPNESPPPSAP